MFLNKKILIIKIIISFFIFFLCSCKSNSVKDSKVKWIKENAIKVNSINPADEDFTDLQPLKKVIGDSVKIVMLGEESHGDGSTFLAKTRLIKFLHKEMGFDIFAIESGMYSCVKAWELIQKGISYKDAMEQSVFPIWTRSKEFQPLTEYLQSTLKTERPIELSGFDCQLAGILSKAKLVWDLEEVMRKYKITFVKSLDWYEYKHSLQTVSYGGKLSESEKNNFDRFSDTLFNQFIRTKKDGANNNEIEFWMQVLLSTKAQANVEFTQVEEFTPVFYLRDIQMGKNLVWLSNVYYPKKKIIVWSANFHITRNPFTIEGRDSSWTNKDAVTMGHVVWQELRNKVYTIGFTAFEGKYGSVLKDTVVNLKAETGSLEDLIHSANLENCILDFRLLNNSGFWLKDNLICYMLGYSPSKTDWTNVFDSIFYIREMKPSTHIQ